MSAHPTAPAPTPGSDGRVVELDVRDDLRNGREPFQRIMAAVAALGPADVLHLRAPFEPVPLFGVLAKRGYAHVACESGPEDWSVWFHQPPASPTEVVLDVRGLEPPEPMVRTLAALETLPDDAVLVQHVDRVPQFLLPILSERGWQYEVNDSAPDGVVVRIHRRR